MAHRYVDRATDRIVESTLRIATWNLWWRFGQRWEEREALIAEALAASGADVVGLQEVWTRSDDDQGRRLAGRLGFHWTGAPASEIDGIGFGNAILSRWPVSASDVTVLPSMPSDDGGRDCNVVHARIEGPRGPLQVFSTHLSWRPEEGYMREKQVDALLALVLGKGPHAFPPIVCGDFNAVPSSDEVRMMTGERRSGVRGLVFRDAWTAAGHTGPGFTWSNANRQAARALQPDRRLDYVFVGLARDDGAGHVVAAGHLGTDPVDGLWPSDHFGLVATVRY